MLQFIEDVEAQGFQFTFYLGKNINDADILQDKGKVTAAIAKAFAENEFEQYRVIQDSIYESDFERFASSVIQEKESNK